MVIEKALIGWQGCSMEAAVPIEFDYQRHRYQMSIESGETSEACTYEEWLQNDEDWTDREIKRLREEQRIAAINAKFSIGKQNNPPPIDLSEHVGIMSRHNEKDNCDEQRKHDQ